MWSVSVVQVRMKPRPWQARWERHFYNGMADVDEIIGWQLRRLRPFSLRPLDRFDLLRPLRYYTTLPTHTALPTTLLQHYTALFRHCLHSRTVAQTPLHTHSPTPPVRTAFTRCRCIQFALHPNPHPQPMHPPLLAFLAFIAANFFCD